MTEKELNNLIELGEGLTIEFKESAGHLSREICAMANVDGGYILIGVDDGGKKKGVGQMNRMKSQVQSAARNLDPSLAVGMEAVKDILVVSVPSGPDKPYSSGGQFYLRDASTTQTMNREEIREFFFKEGLVRWDEQPCKKFSMDVDFDAGKYRAFLRAAGLPTGLKREDVLVNLSVLEGDCITNAGVLLFAKHAARFHLQASVLCAVFQGISKSKILDRQVFEGGIPESYESAVSYMRSQLNTEYIIRGGPRQEVLELPPEALREGVLNALAHRDYRSTSSVQVHVFHDRVEITNPGGLVPGLKMKDLGKVSRPRNMLLFSLMERMGLVEKVGSGIKRMRDAMKAYGLEPPKIETGDDWFSITFKRKLQQVSVEDTIRKKTTRGPKSGKELSETSSEKILWLLRKKPKASAAEIAKELGHSSRAVEKQIAKLKGLGRLERIGPDKGGFWRVKPEKRE